MQFVILISNFLIFSCNNNLFFYSFIVCKSLIDLHKGSISVTSEGEGLGCTFTLKLPVRYERRQYIDESEEKTPPKLSPSLIHFEHFNIKVLLVDDSAMSRKMTSRSLINIVRSIDEAENGSEALDMVSGSMRNGIPYDIVLMDHQMPIMNGTPYCFKF